MWYFVIGYVVLCIRHMTCNDGSMCTLNNRTSIKKIKLKNKLECNRINQLGKLI